jgi:hypothetical protein
LNPLTSLFGSLGIALKEIKEGTTSKGKAKATAQPIATTRMISQPLPAPQQKGALLVEQSNPQYGYHVQALKDMLQQTIGSSSLPFIDHLEWKPTDVKGCPEKLHIRTRQGLPVHAFFDPQAARASQLRIVQDDDVRARNEITRPNMGSVALLEPFSGVLFVHNTQRDPRLFRDLLRA